uniref:DNA mismatch repair proteins mutS family domain-containing protein n=1 Tax=viral metagenome TaxID=1070528 RepID=A0A6C0H6U8_9ZZZZ
MTISDDYFAYYEQYTKEYGGQTCILMQIGSFYEMQAVRNETESIGNLEEVCGLLNILVTKKNKGIETIDRSNPLFAGFPKHAVSKFLPVLLEAGYTVVLIDQDTSTTQGKRKRYVAGIYSPSIQPLDIVDDQANLDGNSLTSLVIEVNSVSIPVSSKTRVPKPLSHTVSYSVANVNMTTAVFELYEGGFVLDKTLSYESLLDEIFRLILRYSSKEMLIWIKGSAVPSQLSKEFMVEYLDLHYTAVHHNILLESEHKEATQVEYQNALFRKTHSHVDFGLLEPLEYFALERHQCAALNAVLALQFIGKHDTKYTQAIGIPKLIQEYQHLVMEMNTLHQLAIIPGKRGNGAGSTSSLFNIINKTRTAVGRRGLKQLLCKPFKDAQTIVSRYALSEGLSAFTEQREINLERLLDNIGDFERYHRKMSLGVLHPYELYHLIHTYNRIEQLAKELYSCENKNVLKFCLNQPEYQRLQQLQVQAHDKFDMEELKRYNLNEPNHSMGNFFKSGCCSELDDIDERIKVIEAQVETLRNRLEKAVSGNGDWIKTIYTEQEGYSFSCTKIRGQLLSKGLTSEEYSQLSIKQATNTCKISSEQLQELSMDLVNSRELFTKRVKQQYIKFISYLYQEYNGLFESLKTFVEIIDVSLSNVKCKRTFNYCVPEIDDTVGQAFIRATAMRHPIIERINTTTPYVPNDIVLDFKSRGMVLYALNSCGKSSLLRSIGLCTVLAQCGLYVPCSKFVFYPFSSIITQVDLYDNLWKAQSSYVTEMVGLRKIMHLANKNSLVLSDELTKGTEVISATAIFAAAVLELLVRESKFVFTTHLQDVAKLPEIKSHPNLQICHLSVNVVNDTIVFERMLKPGPCSELYGLEVAKAVGLASDFMDKAFAIRNELIGNRGVSANAKRSRYNKSKRLEACEICGYVPLKPTDIPLDTHHIKFQCTADENSFTEHYHKNAKFNLVCLCKSCHIDVHQQRINIQGYIQTSSGVKLEFTRQEQPN